MFALSQKTPQRLSGKPADALLRGQISTGDTEKYDDSLTDSPSYRAGSDFSRVPITGAIQTKLKINTPGDAHEQEADSVADKVMHMPETQLQLQRSCTCGGKCPKCRNKQPAQEPLRLQPKTAEAGNGSEGTVPSIVHDVLNSPGRQLDAASRAFFEPRFGRSFSDVRIHTDDRAGASASAVGARAYAVGRNVVFGRNEFSPNSSDGRHLLAHELAHVVQQTSGGVSEVARVPTSDGVKNDEYSYSTNCGWIDWHHAQPGLSERLIARVQQASDALRAAGQGATPTTGEFTSEPMTSKIPHTGIIMSSASVSVRLLRPLSANEVIEVALSIFKTMSNAFETQQEWTDRVKSSSFSQEDLPSNLIAFYMAARRFTPDNIKKFCGAIDRASSMAEYDRNHNFVKNRRFAPVGISGSWPAELSTINDSNAASLYETKRITATKLLESYSLCPQYRVVGNLSKGGFAGLFSSGTNFSAADDLRVVPTYRTHRIRSKIGEITFIEVQPARSSDEAQLRKAELTWPFEVSDHKLQCLTSLGNPG